jgi:xylose isomerase
MPIQDLRPQKQVLTPEERVRRLQTFNLDLKYSAGVWYFGSGAGRWHDAYGGRMPMEQILEMCASLKPYGLAGVEAHYPNEVNEDNLEMFQKFTRDTGIRLLFASPNLFYDAEFEFGSLSSPLPGARKKAIERVKKALLINKQIDADFVVVWPGIDGYEHSFGVDFQAMRRRFIEGLAEAMDAVPGLRIAFEPKPYEPRGHILFGTTPEALLACQAIEGIVQAPENKRILQQGHALVGLNPEVGHVLMGYEDVAYAFSLILEHGRLAHTHWNSQPLGNYDQDMDVGVISPEQGMAALYMMKMHQYRGHFGIDINPERLPVRQALINSMDALKWLNDVVSSLDHEAVVACTEKPDVNGGVLEAMLLRALAPKTTKLSEPPKVQK